MVCRKLVASRAGCGSRIIQQTKGRVFGLTQREGLYFSLPIYLPKSCLENIARALSRTLRGDFLSHILLAETEARTEDSYCIWEVKP